MDNYKRLFPILFGLDHLPNRIEVMEQIKRKYFSDKPLSESYHGVATVQESYRNYLISNVFYFHRNTLKIQAFGICTVQINLVESALRYKGPRYFYHYGHLNKISYKKMYDTQFGLYTNESMGKSN